MDLCAFSFSSRIPFSHSSLTLETVSFISINCLLQFPFSFLNLLSRFSLSFFSFFSSSVSLWTELWSNVTSSFLCPFRLFLSSCNSFLRFWFSILKASIWSFTCFLSPSICSLCSITSWDISWWPRLSETVPITWEMSCELLACPFIFSTCLS